MVTKKLVELAWCRQAAKKMGYKFGRQANGEYVLESSPDARPSVYIRVQPQHLDQIVRTLKFNLKHYKNGVKRFTCPHGIHGGSCIRCDDWVGGAQGYCELRYKATGEKL